MQHSFHQSLLFFILLTFHILGAARLASLTTYLQSNLFVFTTVWLPRQCNVWFSSFSSSLRLLSICPSFFSRYNANFCIRFRWNIFMSHCVLLQLANWLFRTIKSIKCRNQLYGRNVCVKTLFIAKWLTKIRSNRFSVLSRGVFKTLWCSLVCKYQLVKHMLLNMHSSSRAGRSRLFCLRQTEWVRMTTNRGMQLLLTKWWSVPLFGCYLWSMLCSRRI